MNQYIRQQRQYDVAAQQAAVEGVSSFGSVKKLNARQIEDLRLAANSRGVTFIIDEDGVGLFVDDSLVDSYLGLGV